MCYLGSSSVVADVGSKSCCSVASSATGAAVLATKNDPANAASPDTRAPTKPDAKTSIQGFSTFKINKLTRLARMCSFDKLM